MLHNTRTHHVSFDLTFRRNPYKGKIIAIEGIDGAGKTTQAKELVKRLTTEGFDASYTKEPTDDIIGKFIRDNILSGAVTVDPIALQYLFNADKVMHMKKIEKLLEEGKIIVTDRYFWSSVAYAIADMQVVQDWSLTIFSILSFYHQFFIPDFTFLLKINPQTALERIKESGKHTEIYDTKEKLVAIDKAYEALRKEFEDEFITINSERPQNEITEETVKIITGKLNLGV